MRRSVRPHGHGSGSIVTTSETSKRISGCTKLARFVTSTRAPRSPSGTARPSSSTFSAIARSSNRWWPLPSLALRAPQALGRGVEVERANAERVLDRARPSPACSSSLEVVTTAGAARRRPGALLVGQQDGHRRVRVQAVGPERVERLDHPRDRHRDGQREHPVHADRQHAPSRAAHVGRRRRRRSYAIRRRGIFGRVPAHALKRMNCRADRDPARAVVDVQALAAGRAAGRHRAVAAEVGARRPRARRGARAARRGAGGGRSRCRRSAPSARSCRARAARRARPHRRRCARGSTASGRARGATSACRRSCWKRASCSRGQRSRSAERAASCMLRVMSIRRVAS